MVNKPISALILTFVLTISLFMPLIVIPSSALTNGDKISNGYPAWETDKTAQADAQNMPSSAYRWNFNDTSEWSTLAFQKGNRTQIIVGVDSQQPTAFLELKSVAARYGGQVVSTVSMKNQVAAAVVELLLWSVSPFVEHIRSIGLAKYVEPNMKVQTQFTPNDPYWNMQWGPKKVEADWAWNVTTGNSTVLVAVVDTGVDYTHPDLAANYVSLGYDWVNLDSDPLDDYGHGTHVAGTIAAVLNNSVGVAGMAQVSIMAEKVLDQGGGGYWDWVANGIIHATNQGAKIISMSLGGSGDSELVHDAVKYANDAGVLVVAAAGNSDSNVKSYPAGYDEVVAVAATDAYDNKAYFSNWGEWIELAAPGVDVYSTMPTYPVTMNYMGIPMNYASLSGTSMACPHVSGLAALIWSRYPNKTRDWVRLWLRYTADDLGDPGFDVYYGYGRINARKSVEQGAPLHELIASGWETPSYVLPGDSGKVNATVLNFGESDETMINVHLFVNDSLVDSKVIESLASGNSTTVNLLWNSIEEGLYNITVYVEPVLDEVNVQNNVLYKRIYVGFPVKAFVLHSAGNMIGEIITTWQALNDEWYVFGDTMIFIDYTTLDKQDITYDDLTSAGADVLIISCAFSPVLGWEFTDAEIDAIGRYVHEGHGLIVTAGTLYEGVPNNNKLASLVGIDKKTEWTTAYSDLLHMQNSTHPMFKNVPNPFIFPGVGTAVSTDGRWDQDELVGGRYLGLGHYLESSIVEYRGLVYISPWLEIIPPYYHYPMQLLYNAIAWSKYQRPQHELVASLEVPRALKPNQSAQLNATVSNMGLSDETNVEIQLLINGAVVDALTVPELLVDESSTISYVWTPTNEGMFNITAFAVPLPNEDDMANNVDSLYVFVSTLSVAIFENYDPWNFKSNQEILDHYGVPYVVYGSRDFGRVDLNAYSKVVIASDQDQTFYFNMDTYRSWFEDYVSNGGILEIHAADMGWHGGSWVGLLPGGLRWSSSYSQYVTIVDQAHAILNTPNSISDSELDNWNYAVHGYFSAYPAEAHIIIIEDTSRMPAYLQLPLGAGLILASSQTLEWGYAQRYSLILENSLLYMPAKEQHDLAVTVTAPYYVSQGSWASIIALVANRGLNNETSVEVYLLINDSAVYHRIFDELPVGEVQIFSYDWTPALTGTYNVTAYAQPVPGETELSDNTASKTTIVFFYQSWHTPHEWVAGGNAMDWHGDDISYQYSLPFEFPFYGINYRTIYISTNGLITFAGPDTSYINSVPALAGRLAIAACWEDWITDYPHDIYIWQDSTHVRIRWYAALLSNRTIYANFEAILSADGMIQLNYGSSNGFVSATVGISNGVNHIIAEELSDLNNSSTIFFLPYQVLRDVAVTGVEPHASEVTAGDLLNVSVTTENQGDFAENFTLTAYAFLQPIPLATMNPIPVNSTRIYLDPSNCTFDANEITVGYRFNVTVKVDNVERLAIWQSGLYYNRNLINATRWFEPTWDADYVFYNETTLSVGGFHPGVIFTGAFLWPLPPEQRAFNGSGTLCIIEFEVLAVPPENDTYSCALNVDNTDTFLLDKDNMDIYAIKENGYYEIGAPVPPGKYVIGTIIVTNLGPGENTTFVFVWNTTGAIAGNYDIYAVASYVLFETDRDDNILHDGIVLVKSGVTVVRDVAVVMVNVSSDIVYSGWLVWVNVSVTNLGNATESFLVTLYCDDIVVGTSAVEGLYPNVSLTVAFRWDTTSVPRYDNYTLKAVASTVPSEINTVNNEFVYGQVNVRIMGDVNGDGIVNLRDIRTVCYSYGAGPDNPRWSLDADLDQNGRVDMRDIGLACLNFGETA